MLHFVFPAVPSSSTSEKHQSKDQHESGLDGDDDEDYDEDDDDDMNDDGKFATARNAIDRGGDDEERFARPDEVNQICTYLTRQRQATSVNPSKKSSGAVLGDSQIKSDSDLSANFGNTVIEYSYELTRIEAWFLFDEMMKCLL